MRQVPILSENNRRHTQKAFNNKVLLDIWFNVGVDKNHKVFAYNKCYVIYPEYNGTGNFKFGNFNHSDYQQSASKAARKINTLLHEVKTNYQEINRMVEIYLMGEQSKLDRAAHEFKCEVFKTELDNLLQKFNFIFRINTDPCDDVETYDIIDTEFNSSIDFPGMLRELKNHMEI